MMLYSALRLYPNNIDGYDEHLYVTQSVKRRLDPFLREVKTDREKFTELLKILEVSDSVLDVIYRPIRYPYIRDYLAIAKLEGWDLSRDINYAYAQVLYPPKEIERRVMRVFPIARHLNLACFLLESEIGYSIELLKETIHYKRDRSSMCYGKIMQYVMRQERLKGYFDALDFEE